MTYKLWSANPTMAICEQKIQESSVYSVHKARCLSYSTLYTGVPKKKAVKPVKE